MFRFVAPKEVKLHFLSCYIVAASGATKMFLFENFEILFLKIPDMFKFYSI